MRPILASFCLAICMLPAWAEKPSASDARPSTEIIIATDHSALSLCVGTDLRLYELGFGAITNQPPLPRKNPGRDWEFLPGFGNGFVTEPAIEATHADGNTSTDLIYANHETRALDTNVSLTKIELRDRFYPFFVDVYLKAYSREDVFEAWTVIRHEENGIVTLHHFASTSPVITAREYWLTQFHGDWSREAELSEERLTEGTKILDSKIGVRASQYRFPSFILALDGPAREESGQAFGGSLKWSGSYQLAFDVDWNDHLRVLAGINPFASQYHLPARQDFATPAMLWTWSGHGKGQVSRNFHNWARRYGIRDGAKPRPIFLNNWEATGFHFNETKLVSVLDSAKGLGMDLFLLDDGWFGNKYPRNNDHAGLGDWQVNTKKLPQGLTFLADAARQRGMGFGIWIEPEMVNPQSELYHEHPDWAIGQAHREPQLSRNQLVLDLSNPAVKIFAWKTIDNVLSTPGVTYVKWDANRYVTQPGSTFLKPEDQSHLLIDYNWALYDLMAKMAKNFPNTGALLCSGGGGRADYGALQYFDSFWPSDNTDPLQRIFIQWGYSYIFPAYTIRAEVTHKEHRPLKFSLDVAMSEALSFDIDPGKMSNAEKETVRRAIQLYKNDLQEPVGQGDLYRLESPYDGPRVSLAYVAPDRSRAVLFVYARNAVPKPTLPIKLAGLDAERKYSVREVNLPEKAKSKLKSDGKTMTGAALMNRGLVPPCKKQFDSAIIELNAK